MSISSELSTAPLKKCSRMPAVYRMGLQNGWYCTLGMRSPCGPGEQIPSPHLSTEGVSCLAHLQGTDVGLFMLPRPLVHLLHNLRTAQRRPGRGAALCNAQLVLFLQPEGSWPGEIPTWEGELVSPTSWQGRGCFLFSCRAGREEPYSQLLGSTV